MNPYVHRILQAGCFLAWASVMLSSAAFDGWPAALPRSGWVTLAANLTALGGLWGCYVLSSERPWSARQWRTLTLFTLCTVMALGCGLSPWRWGDENIQSAFIWFVGAFGLTHFYLLWQAAKPASAR